MKELAIKLDAALYEALKVYTQATQRPTLAREYTPTPAEAAREALRLYLKQLGFYSEHS